MTSVGRDSALRPTGFRPLGEFLFSRRKRNQNAAGGVPRSPHGSSGATPEPPFTGDTPTPLCKISGAQNTVPGLNSFRVTGPWCGAKFRFMPFHRRAWFRPAVAEGAGSCPRRTAPFPRTGDGRVWDSPLRRTTAISEIRREGQAPPLRGERGNILLRRTGRRPHGAAPTANHGHFRDTSGGASPAPTE